MIRRIFIINFLSLIIIFNSLNVSLSQINFSDYDLFLDTVQSNIIDVNQLSEVNSAQLDFIRANQSQLRMINEKIKFSNFNKVDFIDSFSRLNNLFTNLSFDIYNSSKYYLIKNNVLTPGLDTELKRISVNNINQFYGLPPISTSLPIENSKILPTESLSTAASTGVPTLGLATFAIAGVLGISIDGGGGGAGCAGSCPNVSISSSSLSIYDSDASGFTLTVDLDKESTEPVIVGLNISGTAKIGDDFNGVNSITIPAGSTNSSTTYIPVPDSDYEGTETIVIEISSVTNGRESGVQSVSVSLHEYALRLETTFTDRGNSAARSALREYMNVERAGATSQIHPYTLMNIHKAHAYWDGNQHLSGKGQVIHVADFNCDPRHQEFVQGGKTTTDLMGGAFQADGIGNDHCNLVAGFAVGGFSGSNSANDIMGVAYEADLVLSSVPMTNFSGKAAHLDQARALNAIVSNNSWSSLCADEASDIDTFWANNPGLTAYEAVGGMLAGCGAVSDAATTQITDYVNAIKAFQDNGGIMVFAAGNDQTDNDVSAQAALPLWFPELDGAYLAVAYMEVRGSPTIQGSTFIQLSNPCKQMKEKCLVTDAFEIFGASWHDELNGPTSNYAGVIGGGSSSASPMVSGILALLKQAFPNHTPEQLVDRLLASANNTWFTPSGSTIFTTHGNSIQHGYHDVWGHGIPDAYAALSPITTSLNPLVGIATGGSMVITPENTPGIIPFKFTELTASDSFGDSLFLGFKGENGYFYDALGGGFKFSLDSLLKRSQNEIDIDKIVSREIMNINSSGRKKEKYDFKFNNILGSIGEKNNFIASFSIDAPSIPIQYFNELNSNHNFYHFDEINPFINHKNGGLGINAEYSYGNDKFIIGFHDSSKQSGLFINENNGSKTMSASVIKKDKRFNHLAFISGIMVEQDTLLGAKYSGALGLNDTSPKSYFNGLDIQKNINKDVSFNINTTIARTSINHPNRSLIESFSPISSFSMNFLMNRKNIFNNKDLLTLSITQPNRIVSGSMNIKIQNLADSEGNISHIIKKIDLEPSGRQIDLGFNYLNNINNNLVFSVKSILTKDFNHFKSNKITKTFVASASLSF